MRSALFGVALILAPIVLRGQEVTDILSGANDARGIALGGAATAVANDVSAIAWNAAGLFSVSRLEMQLTLRSQFALTSASRDGGNSLVAVPEGSWSFHQILPVVDFIGVAAPFEIGGRRVVAGLAWRAFVPGTRESQMKSVTSNTPFPGHSTVTQSRVTDGGVRAVSPSVAIKPFEALTVGVTANFLHGTQTYTSTDRTRDTDTPDPPATITVQEFADQRGLAIELGARATVGPALTVGARFALPHTRSGTYSRTGQSDINYEHELPYSVSIGLAYATDSRRRWSIDLRMDPLSGSEFRDADADTAVAIPQGREDVTSIHVGYEIDESDAAGAVTWRLGGYLQPSSIHDVEGAPISGLGVSLGRSWPAGSRTIDVAIRFHNGTEWVRQAGTFPTRMSNREVRLVAGISSAAATRGR